MKLTALKAQIKKPDRVSIFVDGKYSFSLTQAQLLDEKLHVGLEVDEARLAALKKVSDFGKLYARVLNFVMIRPRSRHEIEAYGQRKKYDASDISSIIARLSRLGYVDDARFARSWVESRRLTKPTSQRALRLELRQKGISDELIAEALAQSSYDEAAALRQLIQKKQRIVRYKDPQKLTQYLARQGFSYDAIKDSIKAEL